MKNEGESVSVTLKKEERERFTPSLVLQQRKVVVYRLQLT